MDESPIKNMWKLFKEFYNDQKIIFHFQEENKSVDSVGVRFEFNNIVRLSRCSNFTTSDFVKINSTFSTFKLKVFAKGSPLTRKWAIFMALNEAFGEKGSRHLIRIQVDRPALADLVVYRASVSTIRGPWKRQIKCLGKMKIWVKTYWNLEEKEKHWSTTL